MEKCHMRFQKSVALRTGKLRVAQALRPRAQRRLGAAVPWVRDGKAGRALF